MELQDGIASCLAKPRHILNFCGPPAASLTQDRPIETQVRSAPIARLNELPSVRHGLARVHTHAHTHKVGARAYQGLAQAQTICVESFTRTSQTNATARKLFRSGTESTCVEDRIAFFSDKRKRGV